MTFAEYNTDDNFKGNSTADELVKIGYDEGKSREEIETSLSPLWKEDKKGNVKKALDKYYKTETPKAEETKPTEEKVVETVTETSEPKKTVLDKQSQAYADKQSNTADSAKEEALNDIKKDSEYNWQRLYDSAIKRADAFKQIDDHMVEQLPTFMFKRYQNGEFGDPKGSDAKLRLAHFIINGLGTALSNMSHVIRKDGVQEQSDAEKYQQTNLEQGLQNRWNKYKADTDGAIKAVEKEYGNEQDARLAVEQFTRDHKANVKWNMMDQNQKVFALQVTKEIGSMLGGMDTSELANFIAGAALTGDMKKDEVIAIGVAKLAANAPDIIKNLPDGDIKNMVMGMIGGNPSFIGAGIGGVGNTDTDNKDTGVTLEDGTKIDPGKSMSKEESDELKAEAERLGNKYYNGEITEEQFRKDYAKLEAVMNQHGIRKALSGSIMSADDYIKQIHTNKKVELSYKIDELNNKAKNGKIKPSEYEEQFKALREQSEKYGASKKELKAIDEGKISTEKILKAANKKK
jgi:hypothetical protein